MENKKDVLLETIEEIEKCLDAELYLVALSMSLTLPDVCGKAEYPGENVGKRYKQWYNNYVANKPTSPYAADMPYLSGEVVYSLRNSLLHSVNPNITKKGIQDSQCKIDNFKIKVGRSLFGDTSCVTYGANKNVTERGYEVNARLLCMRLCKAAKEYYLNNKQKFHFFNYTLIE